MTNRGTISDRDGSKVGSVWLVSTLFVPTKSVQMGHRATVAQAHGAYRSTENSFSVMQHIAYLIDRHRPIPADSQEAGFGSLLFLSLTL